MDKQGKSIIAPKGKKKKSLRMTITVPVILLVTGAVLIIAAFGAYMSYRSAVDSLNNAMLSAVGIADEAIKNKVSGLTSLADEIASDSAIYSVDVLLEAKQEYLSERASEYGFLSAFVLSADGKDMRNGKSYSGIDFFEASISGETVITTPEIDEETGELAMTLSAPIWANGIKNSTVTGILCVKIPQTVLNQITSNMHISENGYAYIMDKSGYFVDYIDPTYMTEKKNLFELVKSRPELQPLVDSFSNALSGKVTFNQYRYEGINKFATTSAIQGSDWVICLTAPVSDFTGNAMTMIYISIALAIAFIVGGSFGTLYIANRIVEPISLFVKRLSGLAEGDVTSPMPEFEATSSEFVVLKASLESTLTNTGAIIKDIDYLLSEFSSGNFDVYSRESSKYNGDYKHILTSFRTLKRGLTESFQNILQVSEQVSAGASQVSFGAQSLAQGATEQASSVEELSASIADISQHVRGNAEDAEKAKVLTTATEAIMQSSVSDMNQARQAMDEISATSKNISKVIKTIDDIAFQTNILALNAAVEAARAGAAGKGFAVVADEVRNLSQKSAEAAKNTTSLIESSIEAVEKGTQLVNKTSIGFAEVSEKASEVVRIVDAISEQAQEQSAAISQISIGIEQVSSVVQMNSATSEESAAASEELSSQAEVLKNLVDQFKLATSYQEE